MAGYDGAGFADDQVYAEDLAIRRKVAAVPGSSFFSRGLPNRTLIRFCFCKKYETLEEARKLLVQT
jgi:aminotransferase